MLKTGLLFINNVIKKKSLVRHLLTISIFLKHEFLANNTIVSAKFDPSDVASLYIKHHEEIE
jgi:hypothetical protein